MIKTNDVLTATAVVLEKLPPNFVLSKQVNPIITGLNMACVSPKGYNLDTVAMALPAYTKDHSEHTELVEDTATKISTAIRDSLGVIRSHVIPACDCIEEHIKSIGKTESITERVLSKLVIRYNHLPNSFFDSPLFPNQYDDDYKKGVRFTAANLKQLGHWPTQTYDEILAFLSAAGNYPELHFALQDKTAVEMAWNTFGGNNYWLRLTGDTVDPSQIDIEPTHVNALVVLSLLVNRLNTLDDPFPGVTHIGLNDYRRQLSHIKGFLNTLLYLVKQRYHTSMPNGLMVSETNVKFEVCDEKDSPFYGAQVLSGYVNVTYNDTLADYFGNSDDYSLGTTVIGMLYARFTKFPVEGGNLIERLPSYQQAERQYITALQPVVLRNVRASISGKVKEALFVLADGPWKEVLTNLNNGDTRNLAYVLEKYINETNPDFMRYLLSPTVFERVRDGELRLANTPIAPPFAAILNAPIAKEILQDNISETFIPPEKQRKVLAKAIAKSILRRLLKPV